MVPKEQDRGSRSPLFNGGIVLSFVMPTVRMKLFNYHRLLLSVTYNPHHNLLHGRHHPLRFALHTLCARFVGSFELCLRRLEMRIRWSAYTIWILIRRSLNIARRAHMRDFG